MYLFEEHIQLNVLMHRIYTAEAFSSNDAEDQTSHHPRFPWQGSESEEENVRRSDACEDDR